MCRSGRARIRTAISVFPLLPFLLACITFASSLEYGVPIEIKSWDAGRTPLGHMVDVTNGFGLKVLAEHNFLNDNNIAFSPYGLMGILVALYEGVDGESSFQIQRAMHLPWNRKVMRIGFRDIHRTLKTYFVPEEGFLAGLALNNENVTFNDKYKKILRFYGFDLDNDQLPTMPPLGNSTNGTLTATPTMNVDTPGDTTMITSTSSTMASSEISTTAASDIDTREELTPSPNAETVAPTSTMTPGLSAASFSESASDMSLSTTSTPEQNPSETQATTNATESSVVTMQTDAVTTTTTVLPMTTNEVVTTTSTPTAMMSEVTTPPSSTIPDVEMLSTQMSQASAALTNDPAFDAETIEQQTSLATVSLTNESALNNVVDNPSTTETISSTFISVVNEMSTSMPATTDDNTSSSTLSTSSAQTSIVTDVSSVETPATINDETASSTLTMSSAPTFVVTEISTMVTSATSDNTASSTLIMSSAPTSVVTEMETAATNDNTASSTLTISNRPTSVVTETSAMNTDKTTSGDTVSTELSIPSELASAGTEISTMVTALTSNFNSDSTPESTISTSTDTTDVTTDVTITGSTTMDSSTAVINESSLETLQRRKKSIVDFIFTNPPYLEDYMYYRSYDIPPIIPSTILDDKMFLANGLKSVQVTYMQYDTVLEHAYLPHLEASALRLPLDSDRYYLLVVLPRRGGGNELGRLLARMARESDLSDVYNALRPRHVKGLVPSFTVKGHVTLTTDLQKLGIRDVFEPRQRDFTPMTRQTRVYVRSIEQAVSVAIRKYRPDDRKKNRYVTNRDPVKFYATYPFLYFVMDSSIHVSLMAGKMVDPLNSRIL